MLELQESQVFFFWWGSGSFVIDAIFHVYFAENKLLNFVLFI